MFFNSEIDKVYLINGLSRSGNHLFITWLLSSFEISDTVYFLNNVYPKSDFSLYNDSVINVPKLMKFRVATRDKGNQGEYINHEIRHKLASKQQTLYFLQGKIKKAKVLIISIENNFVDILDFFEKRFTNTKKIYKIIIIRDVLNLFSSRFEAEQKVIKNIKKSDPNFLWHTYETDLLTFGYYVNNLFSTFNKNYITFNYNNFVLENNFRKELAKKLNIDYNKTLITHSKFLTGSSFKNNENDNDVYKYFMRWYNYKDNKLIKFFMDNKELMDLMCKIFNFCFEDNNKILKIKNYTININDYQKLKQKKKEKEKQEQKQKQKDISFSFQMNKNKKKKLKKQSTKK